MISSGTNLVMTVFGFAVSTMFIVFVCTRLICARIQLRNSRRAFPTALRSDLSILERGIHGLEPVLVASFPTKKFGDQFLSPEQDTQCTVCLAEYQEKDVLRILPFCGHVFHVSCIDIWFKQHSTCPVCRISLRDSPDRKRVLPPVYCPAIRSVTPPETLISDPRHFQLTNTDYSLRAAETHIRVPPQQDKLISESSDAQETNSSWPDAMNSTMENGCNHQDKGKHPESPSNMAA